MNGHQHYAEGEHLLRIGNERMRGGWGDSAAVYAALASAHFLAAAAAPALAGRYGDPTRDLATADRAAEAERAALAEHSAPGDEV